jgi:hypothetical protein
MRFTWPIQESQRNQLICLGLCFIDDEERIILIL